MEYVGRKVAKAFPGAWGFCVPTVQPAFPPLELSGGLQLCRGWGSRKAESSRSTP